MHPLTDTFHEFSKDGMFNIFKHIIYIHVYQRQEILYLVHVIDRQCQFYMTLTLFFKVGWIKDIVIDNSKGNQPQLKNV